MESIETEVETGGFLFVGNQLSLDFLNTRPMVDGKQVELLPDSASLLAWLQAAGLLTRAEARRTAKVWPARADAELEKLRGFREAYREVVTGLEAGNTAPAKFIARVNALLAQHSFTDEIVQSESGWRRVRNFRARGPKDAFGPVLDETANLLTVADRSRIRMCANCVLHFYDTSKKGTRRWCSMQLCGNRFKVAAYARRQREED